MSGKTLNVVVAGLALLLVVAGGLYFGGVFDGRDEEPRGVLGSGGDRSPVTLRGDAGEPAGDGAGGEEKVTVVPYEPDQDAGRVAEVAGAPSELKLWGSVLDPQGAPVNGAEVKLFVDVSPMKNKSQEGKTALARLVTGPNGAFTFKNLSRLERYVLRVTHDEYAVARAENIEPTRPDSLSNVVVRLQAGIAMSGEVKDSGGAPIAGATVYVYDLQAQSAAPGGTLERAGTSDHTGAYSVEHLTTGNKKVVCRMEGYASDGLAVLDLRKPQNGEDIDFTLSPGFTIAGRVVDQRSGSGVPGAVVQARPVRDLRARRPRAGGDPPRGRELPLQPGAARQVPTGRKQPVRPQPYARRGELIDELATTGEDGRFELQHLQEARYAITVHCEGYQNNPRTQADAGQRDVNIMLTPSARISGRVLDDATGGPVTSFTLAVMPNADITYIPPQLRRRYDDPEGRFTYPDVRPGNQFVVVEAEGYAVGKAGPYTVTGADDVRDVVVRLEKGTVIRGRVVDSGGSPVGGAVVTFSASTGTTDDRAAAFLQLIRKNLRASPKRAVTDADGRWRIENVTEGSYTFKAEHDAFSDGKSETVVVGDQSEAAVPDIVLRRGGIITGLVRTKAGEPDTRATVMLSSTDPSMLFSRSYNTDGKGRFRATGLEPGTYRVLVTQREGVFDFFKMLMDPQKRAGEQYSLSEGQVLELEL